ncbi:MAG: DUF4432 family protein, partial [Chloroflexota bacterium]
DGDDYRLEISGIVRQARLFGENLVLRRRISTALGSNTVTLNDSVTNEGFRVQPHMMLYHCNLGFPLLSAEAKLIIDTSEIIPRDTTAEEGLEQWSRFGSPTPGYAEQVFRHTVIPTDDGISSA